MSSATRHHVVVIGDDFTPSELLSKAIEDHPRFAPGLASMACADFGGTEFHQGEWGGIREFLGRPADVAEWSREATIIATTFAPVTAEVLDAAAGLELIACGRGGPVNVDVGEATRRGVAVTFAPARNAESVAEFVLGLMVVLTRRITSAERYVTERRWVDGREDSFEKPTGPELEGRTLGIVGFGAIGRRVRELVEPMRLRVLAHDPFVEDDQIRAASAEPVELDALLSEAELVTVHARPPTSGEPLLGADELALMRPGAFLINTSRGENIDEEALSAALLQGRLAGAALDVFAVEPLPVDHALRGLENVLLTPHSAGVSQDVPRRTARILADAVIAWLGGERPTHLLNPTALGGGPG